MLLKFLVASGPTREPLDPVRFISNRSTGEMGRCLARAVRRRRHKLTWISCPEKAETALELQSILRREVPKNDVLVMAAAVADFRPAKTFSAKQKKERLSSIRLVKNPDILKSLAGRKKKDQVFIGFGVESSEVEKKGLKKLRAKHLDLIVMQDVGAKRSPFGRTQVSPVLIDGSGHAKRLENMSKNRLARLVVRRAESLRKAMTRG